MAENYESRTLKYNKDNVMEPYTELYQNITSEKEAKFKYAKELIDDKKTKSLLTIFSSYYII
ncbi:hypothetical protein CUN14_06120 [Enterococcus faecium]|nr:hypothetical protein CUN14_06120 [Enterococcus faecium]